MLRFVYLRGHAFDKAAVAEDDSHFGVRDQVFLTEFLNTFAVNFSAAFIAEFIFQFVGFLFDQSHDPAGISQQVFQIGDRL